MTYRFKCAQCGAICNEGEYLTAPNPFDETDTVTGCPTCKCVDMLVTACDEPGCTRAASSGWPSEKGYRHTCHEHNEWSRK